MSEFKKKRTSETSVVVDRDVESVVSVEEPIGYVELPVYRENCDPSAVVETGIMIYSGDALFPMLICPSSPKDSQPEVHEATISETIALYASDIEDYRKEIDGLNKKVSMLEQEAQSVSTIEYDITKGPDNSSIDVPHKPYAESERELLISMANDVDDVVKLKNVGLL